MRHPRHDLSRQFPLLQKLRQLGDIRRDPPAKLIHGELVDAKPAGD